MDIIFTIISAPFWVVGLLFLVASPWAKTNINGKDVKSSAGKFIFAAFGLFFILIAYFFTVIV